MYSWSEFIKVLEDLIEQSLLTSEQSAALDIFRCYWKGMNGSEKGQRTLVFSNHGDPQYLLLGTGFSFILMDKDRVKEKYICAHKYFYQITISV